MKKTHNTSRPSGDWVIESDIDGLWATEKVVVLITADVRRELKAQTEVQRDTLRVLKRIDRRLAKRCPLR